MREWILLVLTAIIIFGLTSVDSRHSRRNGRRHRVMAHGSLPKRKWGTFGNRNTVSYRRNGVTTKRVSPASRPNRRHEYDFTSIFGGNHAKGIYNPYFHLMVSNPDMVWSREIGWHSLATEDEYHNTVTIIERETNTIASTDSITTTTTTTVESSDSRPWKGEGSFTGDIKLHCLQNRAREECTAGIVQVYYKELEQWGTICGDKWHSRDADVVCQYLNFRQGKALKIGPAKTPDAVNQLSKFLKNINCEGNEWALTDCPGDRLKTNYTCKTTKIAGVKCTAQIEEGIIETCDTSQRKCQEGDRCVDPEYICDGMADCPWGSDEIGCTGENCKKSQYWCGPKGGGCISNGFLCDGDMDCIDGSDERDCEQFLQLFVKSPGNRLKTKRYEVQWQPVTPYVCAQKCREETSFVCTSFDYFKKSQLCLLFSPNSPKRLRKSRKWDHYERQGVEDCTSMNKYRCDDSSCILKEKVCDFKPDCPTGEDEKECEPMILRLRGGSGPHEGRVEAAKGRKFGLICDTHWTLNEANIVCRQLNFSRGAVQALQGGAFARSERRYVLDNVQCRGDEATLEDCRHDGWENVKCQIDHEVGVVCREDETTTQAVSSTSAISTTATTTTTTTTPTSSTTTAALAPCGVKPPTLPTSSMARIVGGRGVAPHEWPWQVGIWLPWIYWCGGSLIHPCWVLTAAHCFMRQYSLSDYTIRLGDHLTKYDENTEQNMKIARLIKHDYNHTSKENDIALLQIVSDSGQCAEITSSVQTVCLPKSRKQFKAPKNCTITGWGKLSATDTLPYAYMLQEATVPLIASKKCARESEYNEIKNSMFCAGFMKGGVDSCQGDSGGPLACQDIDDRYYVWGIVSWGHGCAKPKAPGVYSNVVLYLNWIRENTGLDF